MQIRHSLNKTLAPGAGFRYSPYGPAYNPGAEYWAWVGQEMVSRFPGATPEVIWLVGILKGQGTHLSFPGSCDDPNISFSMQDNNQDALDLFDKLNFRVWLQVEPGDAQVETLFDLVLTRYATHPCLVGVGVDVEWHHSLGKPEGVPVGDDEASAWLTAIRKYNPRYRLFLKHWETNMLPPTQRSGILFVDDSQMFSSLDQMLAEFVAWGRYFNPSPVAFQIGYPADKKWWGEYKDPARTIGESILNTVPNTKGLFWVDFTALEVFPP